MASFIQVTMETYSMETLIGGCSCSALGTESWTCKSEGDALEPDLWQSPHQETTRSLVSLYWQKRALHLSIYWISLGWQWITCNANNATTFNKEPDYHASLMLGTWSMRSGHASHWPSRSWSKAAHWYNKLEQLAGVGWMRTFDDFCRIWWFWCQVLVMVEHGRDCMHEFAVLRQRLRAR